MKQVLQKLVQKENLSSREMTALMERLMQGAYSDVQIAGFLVALHIKGVTPEELAAAVAVMRTHVKHLNMGTEEFVDVVSTGGSVVNAFNISTTAMFIAAGASVPMAKHGNRSINPTCGSNDVLEELGVDIHLEPSVMGEILREISVCYLFGPILHPAMKFAMPSRRSLGLHTIFNMLEPMTNPAGAKKQLIGVYSKQAQEVMAKAFALLGDSSVMLVHGSDGMDEITTTGSTHVIEVHGTELRRYEIHPDQFGIPVASLADLEVSSSEQRARFVLEILKGQKGPRSDVALMNAAACIYISGRSTTLQEGLELARESVSSGRAYQKLKDLISATNETFASTLI